MTTKTNAFIMLPILLAGLIGCHGNAPAVPAVQNPSSASPSSTKTSVQPTPQGCDAISDPAAAEDCRFRAEVLKKRAKSNASPVVKHAPGTIQQP